MRLEVPSCLGVDCRIATIVVYFPGAGLTFKEYEPLLAHIDQHCKVIDGGES